MTQVYPPPQNNATPIKKLNTSSIRIVSCDAETMEFISRELSPATFKVYWFLERHSNKEGMCRPSMEKLAELCAVSTRTITRAVKELEDSKLIEVTHTSNGRGAVTANIYKILNHPRTYGSDISLDNSLDISLDTRKGEVIVSNSQVSVVNPLPPKQQTTRPTAMSDERFQRWWSRYPPERARNFLTARDAWDEIAPDDETFAAIMAGLDLWKSSREWKDKNGQYICAAERWLTERRWTMKPAGAVPDV